MLRARPIFPFLVLFLLAPDLFAAAPPTPTDRAVLRGQLEASTSIVLRPQVAGVIQRVHVWPGAAVQEGQVLFELDSRPFTTEVLEAQNRLESCVVEADRHRSRYDQDVRRYARIRGCISYDETRSLKQEVDVAQAKVAVAKAGLERARLRLSRCRILAPRAGIIRGKLLPVNTPVTPEVRLGTLAVTDLIGCTFEVEERTYLRWRKGKSNRPTVMIGLPGEVTFPRPATLASIDNQIDPRSKTVRFWATLPNPNRSLRPGDPVWVRLALPTLDAHRPESVVRNTSADHSTREFTVCKGWLEPSAARRLHFPAHGVLERVLVKAGDNVKAGQVLFELDATSARIEVERAKADHRQSKIQLALTRQKVEVLRNMKNRVSVSVSKEDWDQAQAEFLDAEAEVQATQAELDETQLQLTRTRLVAPFSGTVGGRIPNRGTVVLAGGADGTELGTLIASEPIHCTFDLDAEVSPLLRNWRREHPGEAPRVDVGLSGEEGFPHPVVLLNLGQFDDQLQQKTSPIRLRVSLPNQERQFVPGQSVRVRLTWNTRQIPKAAEPVFAGERSRAGEG